MRALTRASELGALDRRIGTLAGSGIKGRQCALHRVVAINGNIRTAQVLGIDPMCDLISDEQTRWPAGVGALRDRPCPHQSFERRSISMDDISALILARLYPDTFPSIDAGWRERKSAETRIALLEATIDSLQKFGYSRTSNRTIADLAGISHGTIGHHYTTKLDLIAAVIDYAFYKRMEIFMAEVMKLSENERVHELVGAELYWKSLQTREYAALLELEIASRTDKELKGVYLPRARRVDRIWREEMVRIFPE